MCRIHFIILSPQTDLNSDIYPVLILLVVLQLTIMNFSKPTAETGEMNAFFIYSHFQLTMKVGLSMQLNCRPTFENDLFFVTYCLQQLSVCPAFILGI